MRSGHLLVAVHSHLFVALIGCDASAPKKVCRCANGVDQFRGVSRPCFLPMRLSGQSHQFDGSLTAVGGLAVDHDGSILVTETGLNRVLRVRLVEELPSGGSVTSEGSMAEIASILQTATVSVVAGSRRRGHIDGEPEVAEFNGPTGIIFEAATSAIYVADTGNSVVRVLKDGRVHTLEPLRTRPPGEVALVRPSSLAVGRRSGSLYVAEPHADAVLLLRTTDSLPVAAVAGASDGRSVASLLRWTFVAAVAVFAVGIAASGRNRRRVATGCAELFSRQRRVAPRPPRQWIHNQIF